MIAVTTTFVPGIVPIENALAAVRLRRGQESTRGLAPGLLVPDGDPEWLPAARFLTDDHGLSAVVNGRSGRFATDDRGLDDLLDAAKQRWGASPHVAAALAWRSYAYWLAMPVVVGWATTRRVLLVEPEDVLVRMAVTHDKPLLTIGLRRLRVAVLSGDPLAIGVAGARAGASVAGVTGGLPAVNGVASNGTASNGTGSNGTATNGTGRVSNGAGGLSNGTNGSATNGTLAGDVMIVASEAELLEVLRHTLRERHLDPLLARIRNRVNIGARTLLGSLASGVAYGVVRGVDAPAAEVTATADTLLSTLDVADLVDLQPGPDGVEVQRRTCCLAFTLPVPKVCSGCCLQPQT